AMPGVVAVVRDGSFLGVVARREEQAIKAAAALAASAKWTAGPELPDPGRVYEQLTALKTQDKVISEKQAPVPDGAKVVEATYHRPYQAHAAIAPSCAVAQLQDGKLTVWTHSQGVYPLRGTLAKVLKTPPAGIRCIHMEGAGCYGHNGADDVALDAALLARAAPDAALWARAREGGRGGGQGRGAEDFRGGRYGPAMTMQAGGAVANGRIVDWSYDVWSQSHNMRPGAPDGVNLLASWYMAEP